MIEIYSLKTKRELNDGERQQALDILTPERKAKALRFRRFEDQNKGIATGVLEAYVLWKYAGLCGDALQIAKNEQGKPYLLQRPDVHYNISHAGDWIVCGVGGQPMGIDVEQNSKYSERIVKRFFHESETESILALPEGEREALFARYWTMKESFMKLAGLGFALPLSSFAVNPENGEVAILPAVSRDNANILKEQGLMGKEKPICQFIELETGYQCSLCTKGKTTIRVQQLKLEECIEELLSAN
ncbi:MAG: 4'-phosphopantetheinyl transferase superfamily protein [Lachnospiraceae bacterium]|nr:4'-phosphopantetheinyl transferase superfamily protein [Lachnospiraceae bacterium]